MASRPATLTGRELAARLLVASLVLVGLLFVALALWKMRLVLFLFLLAVVIASAMRPSVQALGRRGVPRSAAIALHYAVVGVVGGLLIWFAVPRALSEVQHAIASVPETRGDLRDEAAQSTGLKHDFLVGLEKRLAALPSREKLVEPGVEVTRSAVEAFVGIFFVFAAAAYWIYERDRVEQVVLRLLPRRRRQITSDTWQLVDLKLGAFVRGQLLLMLLVGAVLSACFWAIGLPYWLLLGAFAGIVEIVPVLGPLAAGAAAIAVGLTVSVETAAYAGVVVLVVRVAEDYLVMPRVLGGAVGLSPLLVLVAVSACGVVLGGLAILLAIPIAAVLATLVDVLLLQKDPAREDVPSVIVPAGDAQST